MNEYRPMNGRAAVKCCCFHFGLRLGGQPKGDALGSHGARGGFKSALEVQHFPRVKSIPRDRPIQQLTALLSVIYYTKTHIHRVSLFFHPIIPIKQH
jgi:hypothetical protein